ncbi:hypothetical protein H5410_048265 [Solanum commersonii]|uniref:Peptidase C1A papain C-terminal domain-containing protein n=1 Tax=Solanum commersonii TaxID=4109 RepID=A0A9J5XJW5_SOLCO|nr:hypothetical protein H5410_048265 [Solanum commersonii]
MCKIGGQLSGAFRKEEIHFEKLLKSGNQSSVGCHAVLIVGFGVENDIEYYLIKTSWGVKWG